MIDQVAIGEVISRRRKRNGMTQDDLARTMNVTAQAVSKWEKGLSLPETSMLPKLGYALSISVDELLVVKAVPYNSETDSLIFEQDFSEFSFDQWEGADFIPNYTGLPQVLIPVEVDGRKTLLIHTSERPTCKRRGISSKSAIKSVPNTVIEMTFKPLGDIDGIAELWMYEKETSKYVRMSARGGNYGDDREFVCAVTGLKVLHTRNIIQYNEWQTFHVEVKPNTTVVSLLDKDRKIIQSYYYDITPADLFQQYHLIISQELGYPNDSNEWHMKTYIEKLKVYVKRT